MTTRCWIPWLIFMTTRFWIPQQCLILSFQRLSYYFTQSNSFQDINFLEYLPTFIYNFTVTKSFAAIMHFSKTNLFHDKIFGYIYIYLQILKMQFSTSYSRLSIQLSTYNTLTFLQWDYYSIMKFITYAPKMLQ